MKDRLLHIILKRVALFAALLQMATTTHAQDASQPPPNIVVIYADDLGYGDVQCYNPKRGRILTPHIDGLASEGMRFTDAHSSSAVCTPSRYTILTGRYHWRTHLQSGVLGGMSPPLIEPDRLTVAGLLKQRGYATACIGKWHLGMAMPRPLTKGTIKRGPTTNGFDYFFGISASLDMPPYAFIENDRFTEAPTAVKNLLIVNGKDGRRGPAAPSFESEQVLPILAKKSADWISAQKDKPFFLYLALNSPHTPLAPTKDWKGKSGLGDYADFVMQTDGIIGEVLTALDRTGVAQNTLVIVTSDNGCAPYIGTKVTQNPRDSHDRMGSVADLEAKGHFPSGPLRGYKSDTFEGGHRVPFIARWPGVVKPGSLCRQLVHQADLLATFADIFSLKLPADAGEDSFSLLPLLKGESEPVREHAVSASINGIPAVRLGQWKYIPAPGSGGWGWKYGKGGDQSQPIQLYDLANDIGETRNLAAQNPERVLQMQALLERLIVKGRSTTGPDQLNDVKVRRHVPKSKEQTQ